MVPVGLRLHAQSLDRGELALDAEQPLDDALRVLVATLAEVLIADDATHVDEVEGRPEVVGERAPDRVVVVDRDRVVDRSIHGRVADEFDVVLEGELRRVDSDHDQPVLSVRLRPRADVRLLAQPVDARQRPEVHEDDMALQLGGTERLGVEPPGRPAERGHLQRRDVQRRDHDALAQGPEPGAELFREELRLLPGGEVPALVDLVEVDEVGVGLLGPAPRGVVLLAGEHAHGHRNGNALGVEEAALVLPVETGRGDPGVRQPVERDVVEDLVTGQLARGARGPVQSRG